MLETFVVDWQMWAGAKVLAGFGVGAIQSTLPVYITEWAPVNIRGAMILAYGIWNSKSIAHLLHQALTFAQTSVDSSHL
jgi:MFS family permease